MYEEILKSIDTIASSNAEQLEYDKTSLCSVVEVTDKAKGKYYVTDGSTNFFAFSQNEATYSEGELVYITASVDQAKRILGSITSENNKIYKEVKYDEMFSEKTYSFLLEEEFSLLANGEETVQTIYTSEEKIDTNGEWFLGICANFNTSLPTVNEGEFGIRIIFNTNLEEGHWTEFTLGIEDMTGEFYQLNARQQAYYNINKIALDGFKIEFYQNNNFLYETGSRLEYDKKLNNKNYTNITVSNIALAFGKPADIEEQFSKIHYSKIKNGNGVILASRRKKSELNFYHNHENIGAITERGKVSFGNQNVGYISADRTKTLLSGDIEFNIKDKSGNQNFVLNEKEFRIPHGLLSKQCIQENADVFEEILFDGFFNNERKITTKQITYYVDSELGDDEFLGKSSVSAFRTLDPILKKIKNGSRNIKIVFTNENEYEFDDVEALNGVEITFETSSVVRFVFGKTINLKNCNIILKGNANGRFEVETAEDDSVCIENSQIDLTFTKIFSNILIEGSKLKTNKTSFNSWTAKNSSLQMISTNFDGFSIISSRCNLYNCIFNNSNLTNEYNQSSGHYYSCNSDIIVWGTSTKVALDEEQRNREYFWCIDGGKVNILNRPIFDYKMVRSYDATTNEVSTTTETSAGTAKMQEFWETYQGTAHDVDGAFGAQCWDGYAFYCKWLGLGYSHCSLTNGAKDLATLGSPGCSVVTSPQDGDILVFGATSSNIYGHVGMYYQGRCVGQNQGGVSGYTKIAMPGTPIAILRPDKFSSGEAKETTTVTTNLSYKADTRKYNKLMLVSGAALITLGEIMKTWCILVNADEKNCYKIDYSGKVANSKGGNRTFDINEMEPNYEWMKSWVHDNEDLWPWLGNTESEIDSNLSAIWYITAFEGYSADSIMQTLMACTVINRLIRMYNFPGVSNGRDIYRYWGGADGRYCESWIKNNVDNRNRRWGPEGAANSKTWTNVFRALVAIGAPDTKNSDETIAFCSGICSIKPKGVTWDLTYAQTAMGCHGMATSERPIWRYHGNATAYVFAEGYSFTKDVSKYYEWCRAS